MALEFKLSDDIAQDAGIKVLAYGPAGVGKTVLCATAPRPIILQAEGGSLSLKKTNLERIFGPDRDDIYYNIPTIIISNVKDLTEAYEWLTESKDMDNFDTICMDSISEIAEKVLSNAKKLQSDPRKAYGDMADKMISIVKGYRDIHDKNVFISAKMEKDKDEVSGMMLYGPSMPGKQVGPALPYLFDEVFRLGTDVDDKKEEYRFIQTQPDPRYVAKDRSGTLDPVEYAHLGHIFNKIRGI